MSRGILFLSLILLVTGCGVRGDPVAPISPVELGHGEPTYRKATESLKVVAPAQDRDPEDKDWDDEAGGELLSPTPTPTPKIKKGKK